ncbi:hypothetical protein [Candidatus Nitrosocosmicus arcticus]|uniref:Uncharacterized protein n=1 Tax=Candidatus Nitrosocosmicus arcticus TaxID=2035267 RepID=A0A557SXX0_9ARCH|nr:hypothetical protein [Candidatus Nitrosocosmicus arcticus]TVP41454.1 hypothetical protein NARC_30169 [Candidatus Nitrosocosmicus arcticus]
MGRKDDTRGVEKNMNIFLDFKNKEINTEEELECILTINYTGRFDSISINSQIEDSSDVFTYTEINGKKINHPYARLSIMKKELQNPSSIRVKAITTHIPKSAESVVKLRATLIQEHKEIASDVKFIKIKK